MATIPATAFFWRRWRSKQWIFASLLGTLVAIAAVAGISISLAPAHISFSITSAAITSRTVNAAGNQSTHYWHYYNFTLVANNTSVRTSASYGHLKAEIWFSPASWIPIDINTTAELPDWQPPGNAASIPVGARFSQASNVAKDEGCRPTTLTMMAVLGQHQQEVMRNATSEQDDWPLSTVVVEARVRFRFGLATTRPYIVRASCWPVNFLNNTYRHFPVECSS